MTACRYSRLSVYSQRAFTKRERAHFYGCAQERWRIPLEQAVSPLLDRDVRPGIEERVHQHAETQDGDPDQDQEHTYLPLIHSAVDAPGVDPTLGHVTLRWR